METVKVDKDTARKLRYDATEADERNPKVTQKWPQNEYVCTGSHAKIENAEIC